MSAFDPKVLVDLDKLLHEPARLAVVSCLAVVDEADFVFLQAQLDMTGGNLSSHLRKLADAEYVAVDKSFVDGRPRTTLSLTPDGRAAFARYLRTIRTFVDALGA